MKLLELLPPTFLRACGFGDLRVCGFAGLRVCSGGLCGVYYDGERGMLVIDIVWCYGGGGRGDGLFKYTQRTTLLGSLVAGVVQELGSRESWVCHTSTPSIVMGRERKQTSNIPVTSHPLRPSIHPNHSLTTAHPRPHHAPPPPPSTPHSHHPHHPHHPHNHHPHHPYHPLHPYTLTLITPHLPHPH